MHAAGIVHRDLKPENVLVTGHGDDVHARLTDFGIAWTAGDVALTRLSRVVGTPAYIAPELVAGRPATSAADVYALGVVAYELLTGARPFDGDHPAALLRAHLEDEPARPPGLPAPVWQVVAACLAKEPAARPTAAELATVLPGLGALLAGDAAQALPEPVVGPTPLAMPGQHRSVGLAGLGLATPTDLARRPTGAAPAGPGRAGAPVESPAAAFASAGADRPPVAGRAGASIPRSPRRRAGRPRRRPRRRSRPPAGAGGGWSPSRWWRCSGPPAAS